MEHPVFLHDILPVVFKPPYHFAVDNCLVHAKFGLSSHNLRQS
jgi:hypothetical protein